MSARMLGDAAATDDLAAARAALLTADLVETPAERYLVAYTVALRTAAVVLARWARPAPRATRQPVWQVVAAAVPELTEWAGYFAAIWGKRQAVAAGATALVTLREADDLVRDVGSFQSAVAGLLRRARLRAQEAG